MADDFRLLIAGELVEGESRMAVIDPATAEPFGACPAASPAQLDDAVAAAGAAFPGWSAAAMGERQRVLGAIADRIEAHRAELALLLTREQGKPLRDAEAEVDGVAAMFRWFAAQDVPARQPESGSARHVELVRKPLGVVAAIVPWNYPLSLMASKVAPALLTGNTVVVKPAPTTPLATLRFAALVRDLVPPGAMNVIADRGELGAPLAAHPGVRKIAFTGSTETGRKIMAAAAGTLKRLTLELGGNDAAIVLPDADPAEIAPSLYAAAFRNNGQLCVAIKRLYVHDRIYAPLCAELAALASAAIVGSGLDGETRHGPVHNAAQLRRLQAIVADSRTRGTIVAGGEADPRPGYFLRPTIVRDIAEGAMLVEEEQFGPVLPVIRFDDPEDALRQANASAYGLGGSIWSSDPARARALAMRLATGVAWVNTHGEGAPHLPFGGAKQSGIGVEMGPEGIAEYTQLQLVSSAT